MNRQTQVDRDIRRWVAPVEALIAASASGGFTLPADLLAARDHLETIRGRYGEVAGALRSGTPDEVSHAIAVEIAATVGRSIPDDLGARQLATEAAWDEARATLQVLAIAETHAAAQLRELFEFEAGEVVTEHLRPALVQVIKAAKRTAPKLQGVTTPSALVALDDADATKSWNALGVLFAKYQAIRAAYGVVFDACFRDEVGEHDSRELAGFLSYAAYLELDRSTSRSGMSDTPGGSPLEGTVIAPTEPAAFLAWLVTSDPDPDPWLPLPEELAPAMEAAYAARNERITAPRREAAERRVERDRADEHEREQREQQPVRSF